jgi:hypothetical protein
MSVMRAAETIARDVRDDEHLVDRLAKVVRWVLVSHVGRSAFQCRHSIPLRERLHAVIAAELRATRDFTEWANTPVHLRPACPASTNVVDFPGTATGTDQSAERRNQQPKLGGLSA